MSRPLPTPATPENEDWTIKVLYDHACPMCRREVAWLNRRDKQARVFFEDISSPEFAASKYDLDQAAVEGAIHGVLPGGEVISGVEVFRRMYAAVGLGWLLAPTRWPLVRPLADAAYRWFARHRLNMGNAMGRECDNASCRTAESKTAR